MKLQVNGKKKKDRENKTINLKKKAKKLKVGRKSKTIGGNFPWIIIRLLSFLTNISITYAVIYAVLPQLQTYTPEIVPLFEELVTSIQLEINKLILIPEIGEYTALLKPYWVELTSLYRDPAHSIISFVLIYLVVDLISLFLFGTTFAFFISGISSGESFTTKRIKALFRLVIGTITTPLIIFDLPVIFKKRSFKEFITGTQFYSPSTAKMFLPTLVILPATIISMLISPFTVDLDNIDGITFTTKDIPKKELLSPNFSAVSKHFKLITNTTIPNSWKMIPRIKKQGKYKNNEIIVFDQANSDKVKFSLTTPKTFISILTNLRKGNPLFFKQFPATNTLLKTKDRELVFNKKIVKELEEIIKLSLTISPFNLYKNITKTGPFLNGHITLRKELCENYQIDKNSLVSSVVVNDRHFIEIINKNGGHYTHRYLPIDGPNFSTYQFNYSKKSKNFANNFISTLFYTSKLIKKRNSPALDKVGNNYISKRTWDSFMVIDFLYNKKSLPPRFNNGLVKFYKKLSSNQNKIIKKIVDKSLEEIILEIMSKEKSIKHPQVSSLITEMKNILRSDHRSKRLNRIERKNSQYQVASRKRRIKGRDMASKKKKIKKEKTGNYGNARRNSSLNKASRKLSPPKF